MTDKEYEKLKTRRLLPVIRPGNTVPSDGFVLEDAGKAPQEERIDPISVQEDVRKALKTVYDPEIPLNIYDLGLIYGIEVNEEGFTHVVMTLTAPGCPVAGSLVQQTHDKVRSVPGVTQAKTELVWEPAWTRDRMTEAAKLELGLL